VADEKQRHKSQNIKKKKEKKKKKKKQKQKQKGKGAGSQTADARYFSLQAWNGTMNEKRAKKIGDRINEPVRGGVARI